MKRVLIAEDLKDLIPEQGSFFDRSEIAVRAAATSDEMLEVCRTERVDLIITQLDQPGLGCEEFFRTIRTSSDLKHISTIILYTDTLANRERCRACSPNAVLTLPVEPALLYLKVQQFLNVAPRMNYRAALAIAIAGEFKNTPLQFWTENISASGMLIRAEEPLALGDGIFFSFFLADGAHISGYGEITRVEQREAGPDSYLFGVKFTNIEPGVKAAIEAAVKQAGIVPYPPFERLTDGLLSACNTGAAEGQGAEAVSGLDRAFFYAGTRSLLVSMWPVETTSARKLVTGTFQGQHEEKSLTRARSLRRSMLALIDKEAMQDGATGATIARYARPLFWAPLVIVGDRGSSVQPKQVSSVLFNEGKQETLAAEQLPLRFLTIGCCSHADLFEEAIDKAYAIAYHGVREVLL